LDQGLPRSAASLLRERGFDAVHVGEIGMATAEDSTILDFARSEDRVCCTLDADFHQHIAIHRLLSPSTIRIRIEGLKGGDVANLLAHIWEKMEQELRNGAAVTVSKHRIRTRKLPLIGKKD
jgi:predicted nuclease of predicted toxin-antitoxin system